MLAVVAVVHLPGTEALVEPVGAVRAVKKMLLVVPVRKTPVAVAVAVAGTLLAIL